MHLKTLTLTAAMATFLLSCNVKSENGFPGNIMTKEGKGIIKTKEYKMDFDEIKVSQSISAEIVKSNEEKVVVSAPSDIIDDIVVDNSGGKLSIRFRPN